MNSQNKFSRNIFLKYLQDYRFNSILVKSLIIILVVLLCSFAIIATLVMNKMNESIEKEVGNMSVNALKKTQERIDTVMREVVQISGQLSLDPDIRMILLPDTDSLLKKNNLQAARRKIESNSNIVDYIDSIYVYSSKNDIIVTGEDSFDLEVMEDMTWFSNLTERIYEPARMVTRLKDNNFPYLISYIKPIRLTQMEFLGGIIVNIDIGKLDELVITNVSNSKENLIIIDDRNNIIFSSNQNYLLKKIDEIEYFDGLNTHYNDEYQIVNDGNDDIILTVAYSDYFDWRYVSTVPLSLYQEYNQGLSNFFWKLVLLIIVIAISASIFISFYSYTPVMNILNLIKNPELYKNSIEGYSSFQKDESQEISLNIIRNIYSNEQLQKEMKNYMSTIDKAHITALQAQISPHFLYNTLENIRWKAMEKLQGDNEVSQVILKLSEMLRMSLDGEKQIITIEDEIRNAKLYIDILRVRYGEKIRVDWDVEASTLALPIVKISLQPLIENSVYHGIKPLRDIGIIRISVQKLAHSVVIKIVDNGIGIEAEELTKLNRDLDEKYLLKENHIGIRNVNQRLKLLMGDNAKMKILSKVNHGTTVILEVPFMKENS